MLCCSECLNADYSVHSTNLHLIYLIQFKSRRMPTVSKGMHARPRLLLYSSTCTRASSVHLVPSYPFTSHSVQAQPVHKHAIVIAGWPCDSVWPAGLEKGGTQPLRWGTLNRVLSRKSIYHTATSPPPCLHPLNSPLFWGSGERRTLPIIVFSNEWVVSSHVYTTQASSSEVCGEDVMESKNVKC